MKKKTALYITALLVLVSVSGITIRADSWYERWLSIYGHDHVYEAVLNSGGQWPESDIILAIQAGDISREQVQDLVDKGLAAAVVMEYVPEQEPARSQTLESEPVQEKEGTVPENEDKKGHTALLGTADQTEDNPLKEELSETVVTEETAEVEETEASVSGQLSEEEKEAETVVTAEEMVEESMDMETADMVKEKKIDKGVKSAIVLVSIFLMCLVIGYYLRKKNKKITRM